jgi:hypothetical protein
MFHKVYEVIIMTGSDNTENLKFRPNKTFICSVVFLDIVKYSKKPVEEQIILKERFNTLIAENLADIPVSDHIMLDTPDGMAIGFLGDPEDALFAAMNMRDSLNNEQSKFMPNLRVRIGINLGPVKLIKDINNHLNLIGDGLNVAQRIMSFAETGQLLVSRSYYDIVSCLSQEYAQLFHYKGARADKHIREHDIYAVRHTGLRTRPSHSPPKRKASAIADDEIIIATGTPSKNIIFDQIWTNNKMRYIAVTVIAFIVAAMFVFIPPEKDMPSTLKKSTKASSSADKDTESKKTWWESNSESHQQSISGGSVTADEIVFKNAGIRSAGEEVTLSIRIRNNSGVVKSVALYDSYVTWPKSQLIDQVGNTYEVASVIFLKGSQKITSQAAGTQGVSISPNETISASLIFKKHGKGIKSINIHPFIYQGRGWKEHDLPLQIGS